MQSGKLGMEQILSRKQRKEKLENPRICRRPFRYFAPLGDNNNYKSKKAYGILIFSAFPSFYLQLVERESFIHKKSCEALRTTCSELRAETLDTQERDSNLHLKINNKFITWIRFTMCIGKGIFT